MNHFLKKFCWLVLPLCAFLVGRNMPPQPSQEITSTKVLVATQAAEASLISALEARSSVGFRRLMDNGRINHNQRLAEWAGTDPAACYMWIMSQERWHPISLNTGSMLTESDPLLTSLYLVWAERDPRAALEAVGKAKINANMGQFEILWELLKKDPLASLALFHEYPKDNSRGVMRGVNQWAHGDLAAITQAAARIPAKWREMLLPEALAAWGSADPSAALAWLQNEPEPPRDAFRQLISGWAQKDATAALAYLRKATAEDQQKGTISVVEAIGKQDKMKAWQLAQEFHAIETAGKSLLYDWKRSNPAGSAAAVAALDDPQLSERISLQLAESTDWSATEATAWSAAMVLDVRQDFMTKVVGGWTRDKMDRVTAYLNSAPVEMITPELMNTSVRHWSQNNQYSKSNAEAVAWAMSLPKVHHNSAITSIFRAIPWFIEPKELEASIQTVADPDLRALAVKALSANTAARLPKAEPTK